MPKIYGDEQVIRTAKNAKAGSRSVHVAWDVLSQLPEEYEVVITEIKYDPSRIAQDFSDVGNGTWMPQPQIMYKIAEACGISGGEKSIGEPMIEEVDINPMLMKSLEDAPTYRKMTVGRTVRKYSSKLQEDGAMLRSSICTSNYNVWERCLEAWSTEEMYTNNYTKPGRFENKYDSALKRRAHFDKEMKFAHAKAETKAHLKTIRELAGLVTGYKTEDLKGGNLIFAKIRRSRETLKAETAARLFALCNKESEDFSATPPTAQVIPEFAEPKTEAKVEKSLREKMVEVLTSYFESELIIEEMQPTAKNILLWLDKNVEAERDPIYWDKALAILEQIESQIPYEGRIVHGIKKT